MTTSASGPPPGFNPESDAITDLIAEMVPELGEPETEKPPRPRQTKKPRLPKPRLPLRVIGIIIAALLAVSVIAAAVWLLVLAPDRPPNDFSGYAEIPDQSTAPDILPTPTPEPEPQTLPPDQSVENAVLQAVNQLRRQEGLNPLVMSHNPLDAAYGASLALCFARQRDRWDLGPHTRHTLAGGIQYIRQLQQPNACRPAEEPSGQPLTRQAADAVSRMASQPTRRAVLLQPDWKSLGVSLDTDGFRLSVSLRLVANHVARFEQAPRISEAGLLTLDVRLNDTASFPIQGRSQTLPAAVYYQPPPSAAEPYGTTTTPDCYDHGWRIAELRRRPEAIPADFPVAAISRDYDNQRCDGNIDTRPMDVIVPWQLDMAPDRISLTADLSTVIQRYGPGIYTVAIGGSETAGVPPIAAYAIPYRVRLNPTAVAAYRPPARVTAAPSPTAATPTATAVPSLPPLPAILTQPTATIPTPPTPTPAPPTPAPTPPLTPQNARTVADWLTLIGERYPDYAQRLTRMSFHRGGSPEALAALRTIYQAGVTDSHKIFWIFEQPAVQDGINRREAVWVATMADFLLRREDYHLATRIINTPRQTHEQEDFTTPAGRRVTVNIARNSNNSHNLLRQIRRTIADVENYMGEPFPASTVTVIYAGTGDEHARAYWTPTHVVLPTQFDSFSADSAADRYSTTTHEIAHYYWHHGAKWLNEGAAELISAASHAYRNNQPVRHAGYANHRPCEKHRTIAELTASDAAADNGCAYFLGERFFQTLMRNSDPEDFRQGMRRLYRLTLNPAEQREPIALVREAFDHNRIGLDVAVRIWYQGDAVIDDRPKRFYKPSDLPTEPGSYRLAGCALYGRRSLRLSDDCRFHQDGMVWINRTYRQAQEQELTPGRFYLMNVIVPEGATATVEHQYCRDYPYRSSGPNCDIATMTLPSANLDSSEQTLRARGWLSPIQPMTVHAPEP